MPRPQRVTLEMISQELNLSTSSVSRALRNDPLIHPETRARVNSIATRLGYQGRSRRGPQLVSRAQTIGAIFAAHSLVDVQSGPVTMSYIQGMTSEANPAGILLNISTASDVPALNGKAGKNAQTGLSPYGGSDILVICGRHEPARVAALAKSFPLVSFVRAYQNVSHDLVSTDDLNGISLMVAKLVELGHRKMAWVSFEEQSSYCHTRRAGFTEGCLNAGLPLADQIFVEGVFNGTYLTQPEKIMAAVRQGITAFVTASDHAAYEISELLQREKIRIPEEISVTGFDAIGEPGRRSLVFTTYDPRFVEMGRAAVQLAQWRLKNPSAPPLQITVGGCLIEGETTGPAPTQGKVRRKGGRAAEKLDAIATS
ncbi:MAG TPA: LacI family DNA-binding transcriptional regulator [Candidatus Methylacidiphilales bacterium]|nr:LacI family DNA-binding transcriptional regulator [Candidatus Methylacidiphilales bacterium]